MMVNHCAEQCQADAAREAMVAQIDALRSNAQRQCARAGGWERFKTAGFWRWVDKIGAEKILSIAMAIFGVFFAELA